MITKQDIIIENDNGINIIPAGTNIEEKQPDVNETLYDMLLNAKVVKNSVTESSDNEDGTQTDVDDFDTMLVTRLNGEIIATCQIPIALVQQTEEYKQIPDINQAIVNFGNGISDGTDFNYDFVSNATKNENIKSNEGTTIKFFAEVNGDILNVTIKADVDMIIDSQLVRKGGYSRG